MQRGVPEDLLRALVPQVLGTLLRSYGPEQFDVCEDAVQEAVVQALQQWPTKPPRDPRAWLMTAARRRAVDEIRSERARRAREQVAGSFAWSDGPARCIDDSLEVLALCCHPALTPTAQVALTLRAVAGLTTAQIAHALLIPEPTAAQRISRAKATIRAAGGTFPPVTDPESRIDSILKVIYLTYTAGHTVTAGDRIDDPDLTAEATRLARMLHAVVPEHGETTGLLALMLLTDARRAARTDGSGALVPLDEQNRSKWNHAQIAEGTKLVREALRGGMAGPYLLQAAIAALHDEAPDTTNTDWQEIVVLYKLLEYQQPNPITTLNRAVAEAMAYGPAVGLRTIAEIADDPALTRNHRLHAVRAHLLERVGERERAREDYLAAARMTLNLPEQRYLRKRADRVLTDPVTDSVE
jgi:RNA polymerase sigma factor (sigma-70 family)